MIYRIEVCPRGNARDARDARGASLCHQAEALGIGGIQAISVTDLYFLEGPRLDDTSVRRLAETLLCDPVVEEFALARLGEPRTPDRSENLAAGRHTVEVALLPGVTDSVAEHLLEGARLIGVQGLERAATGRRYVIGGEVDAEGINRLAAGLLSNEVIQTYAVDGTVDPPFVPVLPVDCTVETIPLTGTDAQGLEATNRERRLSLDLAEMRAIQAYFQRAGRDPTDVELEMLAQTWSEHCVHKTFKAVISYESFDRDGGPQPVRLQIDSLLNTYIRGATEKVAKPWVRSAFVDNAGIIAFDEHLDLAFKLETHNHPSALEPFGGANTGVGGVIRDVIGVSARPIACTDVLCFGPPDLPFSELQPGILHPRRVADGVTAGIEDYGNKMGIPTVNGAILYDPGYTANPLVFCGCLGVLPCGSHRAEAGVGDLVVVIGGRTGRDGLRGATFSSMEMDHRTSQVSGSAVQIGHPIHEKQALEAVLLARDEGLYSAITDCGAGGLSSAVGEMAAVLGAEVHLERVPLKYSGLRPWEIWLSEAQERMVVAVPASAWPRLQQICSSLDVEATAIGAFTGDGRITLLYEGRVVGQLDAEFLHDGIPRRHLHATWRPPELEEPDPTSLGIGPGSNHTVDLLRLLAAPNTRSKEDVIRRYDHEVQGATVGKPLSGMPSEQATLGPADAAVLGLGFASADVAARNALAQGGQPQPDLQARLSDLPQRGVALSVGINPRYGLIDPYAMAWAAVDEAVRNCVAAGADPDQIALLDNFCWGNPKLPDRLGGLVRCTQGCHDAAVLYGAPFISGKDSLNNEYTGKDGSKQSVPGTLLISALAIVPDVRRTASPDLKRAGNWLYLGGLTDDELGGSAYYQLRGVLGSLVPRAPSSAPALARALHRAIAGGLVQACHDCSEGGLAVAAAEMCLGGGLGAEIDLGRVPCAPGAGRDHVLLFSESLGRFLVEVTPEQAPAFEAAMAGLPVGRTGRVLADPAVRFVGLDGSPVVETDVAAIAGAWRGHLQGGPVRGEDVLNAR